MDNAQLHTEIGNIGLKRTRLQDATTTGSLEKKLLASSTSSLPSQDEVTIEEANARFF